MKTERIIAAALVASVLVLAASCAQQKKVAKLQQDRPQASLVLPTESEIPELKYRQAMRDTLVVKDDTGKEMLVMKAVRDDETGEMVANEVIQAAVVTARFRNVAERRGKVDIRFQIIVPKEMQDSKWQLRFFPEMHVLEEVLDLDPVYITGKDYRKAQLKGYQQYERFLSKIISDTTAFINVDQLEKWLARNLPQVYSFKFNQEEVSDEVFYSYYGLTERDAVRHYTYWLKVRRNNRRLAMRDKMYNKYVKAPIVSEGLRLDTVMVNSDGDFVYDYVQTVNTRPKLRKVDVFLQGDIYEQDKQIYTIPRSEPLTFYISSLSAFTDLSEKYLTKVIERRAAASASYRIEFAQGRSDIEPARAGNEEQIAFVKENLVDLLQNTVYDLDSIVVVANSSPEGSWATNGSLSKRRGEAVVKYFEDFIKGYRRQLAQEGGFSVDEQGRTVSAVSAAPDIRFISHSEPENWDLLDRLVRNDPRLSDAQKERYFSYAEIQDKDRREAAMKADQTYRYIADSLYARLRVVDFDFHLHRKGMVKDTVNTTVLDENYMKGVQLLKDMEYDEAVKILGPYQDYNAAVAYMAAERNASAMLILQGFEKTPQVNYLLAILYSRLGNEKEAVQCYLDACRADRSYVHRGNLDPEVSQLIKLYGLNTETEQDDDLGL